MNHAFFVDVCLVFIFIYYSYNFVIYIVLLSFFLLSNCKRFLFVIVLFISSLCVFVNVKRKILV